MIQKSPGELKLKTSSNFICGSSEHKELKSE